MRIYRQIFLTIIALLIMILYLYITGYTSFYIKKNQKH